MQGLRMNTRQRMARAGMGAVARLTGWTVAHGAGGKEFAGYPRLRVPWGPLRGTPLILPAFERPAMVYGVYERHVVAAMRRYVRPGESVYDVGAHVGYLSLVLSRLVGARGNVFSFEPNPANYPLLCHNTAHAVAAVHAIPQAVADTPGIATFASFASYSLVGHLTRDAEREPGDAALSAVQQTSLDAFTYERVRPLPTPPSFIKVDVEGAEVLVLEGARRLMHEARPVIVLEVRAGAESWERVREIAYGCGYRTRFLQGDAHDLARWGIADVALVPSERADE